MSDTCSLSAPFGDPWPSRLLPCQYHSPLCLSTERNSVRGKWQIRIIYQNRTLVRFTSGWVRNAIPGELSGVQFNNKRQSGCGERNFLVFLEQSLGFHHRLLLHVGQGSFLVPTWSSQFINYCCSCVHRACPRDHQLSELGRIWVSYHHCFIVWGHVLCFCCMALLLSKLAWFSS